jgi:NAD(P)H-flavin reductase
MMSMLHDCLPEATGRLTLLFGERTNADLMYRASLDAWAASYERFTVRYVLSDEDGSGLGAAFRTGYVQDHLADALPSLDDPRAYVCGVPEMVVDTKQSLVDDHGLAEDAVFSEGWEDGSVE